MCRGSMLDHLSFYNSAQQANQILLLLLLYIAYVLLTDCITNGQNNLYKDHYFGSRLTIIKVNKQWEWLLPRLYWDKMAMTKSSLASGFIYEIQKCFFHQGEMVIHEVHWSFKATAARHHQHHTGLKMLTSSAFSCSCSLTSSSVREDELGALLSQKSSRTGN